MSASHPFPTLTDGNSPLRYYEWAKRRPFWPRASAAQSPSDRSLAYLEFESERLLSSCFCWRRCLPRKLHNYLEKLRELLCQKLSAIKTATIFWNVMHCDGHTCRQSIVSDGEFIEPCLQAVEVVGEVTETESGLI